MATTFVIACPECAKQVKVSDAHVGKKIRCKGCGHVYPVEAPAEAAAGPKPSAPRTKAAPPSAPKTKAAPSAPKTTAAPPEPAPAPEPPKPASPDEEYDPNDYSLAATNDTLPRCPFCAKEMASDEARVCLNCGYDTRTRMRPEVKAIYEPTGGEIFLWLLPGILTVLTMIGMLVWYLFFYSLIEDWLADSWFEDEPGPPRTYLAGLGPPFMRLHHALLIAFLYVPMTRFAFKRLVKENRPPERHIKGD
jgi:hypothetical protein